MEAARILMDVELRTAGRGHTRLGGGGRGRPARVLLAAGVIALVGGIATYFASVAPYFTGSAASGTSATATLPPPVGPAVDTAALPAPTMASTPAWSGPTALPAASQKPGFVFVMSVPALGYRSGVLEGVQRSVLDRGPGHYPTTPWPGQPGNVGVAAHNTYWLSFSRLKAGDRVEIRTPGGLYVYEITGSRVVGANDRTVLVQTADHRLTLTTCYPLWAGAFATQRLVFTAREIGGG
jgi:LPXTG-site transpeptidase (sortase) family protein